MVRSIRGYPRRQILILALLPFILGLVPVGPATAGPVETRGAERKNEKAPSETMGPDRGRDGEVESLLREMGERPSESSLLRLGELLLKRGEADGALKCFDEALKMNPRSLEAKIGRGVALAGLGQLDRAEEALREAIPLNPSPARVHYELGRIFERRGDYAKAAAEYREGLKGFQEGMK